MTAEVFITASQMRVYQHLTTEWITTQDLGRFTTVGRSQQSRILNELHRAGVVDCKQDHNFNGRTRLWRVKMPSCDNCKHHHVDGYPDDPPECVEWCSNGHKIGDPKCKEFENE